MKVIILIFFSLLTLLNTKAQVSIGTQSVPNVRAILDLTNGSNLGLLLPITLGDPSVSFPSDPEGMLIYHKDNLFLKGSSMWNPITPWKSKFVADAPVNVYFNPAGYTGVGIGIDGNVASNIKANLHVAFNSKEVSVANSNAAIMIGDTDDGVAYMSFDNDEIAVKTGNVAPAFGTLKLQEGGGTVQVGKATALVTGETRAILNVYGEVQQNGAALIPPKGIIMFTGSVAPIGWALCHGQAVTFVDGTTGTAPDLRERFIVGSGGENTTNPVTGTGYALPGAGTGANSFQLAPTHLPNHKHEGTGNGATMNITSSGTHAHTAENIDITGVDEEDSFCCNRDSDRGATVNGTTAVGGNGSHTHPNGNFNGNTGNGVSLSGSALGTAVDNRPPYYALAYIMKL